MKKRLLAIILSMTLFVLSVVGVGAVDAKNTFSVISMNFETGIESKKVYDVSDGCLQVIREDIISRKSPKVLDGTPVSHIAENSSLLSPCIVIGENETTLIENTTEKPYSSVAYMELVWAHNIVTYTYGTAFLISDNVALTSASCIYNPDLGGYPETIAIFPAKNGIGFWNDPYGSCYVTSYELSSEWQDSINNGNEPNISNDWAILELETSMRCDHLSFYSPDFGNLLGGSIKISGYPKTTNIPECKQYEMDGTVYGFDDNFIYTQIDTLEGMSGSPVIHEENGTYTVWGIYNGNTVHQHSNENVNYATRINNNMEAYFNGFIAAN